MDYPPQVLVGPLFVDVHYAPTARTRRTRQDKGRALRIKMQNIKQSLTTDVRKHHDASHYERLTKT